MKKSKLKIIAFEIFVTILLFSMCVTLYDAMSNLLSRPEETWIMVFILVGMLAGEFYTYLRTKFIEKWCR